MTLEIEVVGLPAPQGSKTGFYNQKIKRVQMTDGPKNSPGRVALDSWREAVGEAARRRLEELGQPPLSGPMAITIAFRFPPVASDPYRFWHAVKPDLDKLARSTFDALKYGGAIQDDSMISKLTTLKRYINGAETAGCSITIESLAGEEFEVRQSRKERAAAARRAPSMEMQALPL